MDLKALITLQKDGETYLPGTTVPDVDDKEAEVLVRERKAERVKVEVVAPTQQQGGGNQGGGSGGGQGGAGGAQQNQGGQGGKAGK